MIDNLLLDQQAVIIHENENKKQLIQLDRNKEQIQNSKGTFLMSDLLNNENGSIVLNNKRNEQVFILDLQKVLVTETISHKTQILYHMDISLIIQHLDIKPGSIVVESGTGSGSLSYSLATQIGQKGQLHTFEFNQERHLHNLHLFNQIFKFSNVQCYHRDVCQQGFQLQDINHNYADAVFLDLPKPFEAIHHAKMVLKPNGRICCFSPCIEQVQQNCNVLKKLGFINIQTIESLQRTFNVQEKILFNKYQIQSENQADQNTKKVKTEYGSYGPAKMRGHTGYLTFAILY